MGRDGRVDRVVMGGLGGDEWIRPKDSVWNSQKVKIIKKYYKMTSQKTNDSKSMRAKETQTIL